MGLTAAERKRLSRQRAKEAQQRHSGGLDYGDDTTPFLVQPFFEFYEDDGNKDTFETPLEMANIVPPSFEDDGPAVYPDILAGLDLPDAKNSIERAQLIVDCLVDAAAGLAGIINRYKLQEINRAIADLEARDLSDPAAKKAALAEIVRLSRLRDRLEKQVRHTMPEYRVKGG